jgi:hypothetical protein
MRNALPMVLYWPLSQIGIAPLAVLHVHAFIEPLLFALAVYFLSRSLFPTAGTAFRVVLTLTVASSSLISADLGRWGSPHYLGYYYIPADAARLLGIAFILNGRTLFAALALAFSFACHPIIGGIGGIFVAATMLGDYRRYLTRQTALAAIVFVILVALWFHFTGLFSSFLETPIDERLWFEINRFGSYHFFPLELGVFTFHNYLYFPPFLACVLLGFLYLPKAIAEPVLRRQVLFGIIALLGTTTFGVIASIVPLSPGVVKLALHRSSDLLLVVGGAIALRGLWLEITRSGGWAGIVAVGILLSPFFFFGFPLLLALLLSFNRLARVRGAEWRDPQILALGFLAVGATVWVAYQFRSLDLIDVWDRYGGREPLLWTLAITAGLLLVLRCFPHCRTQALRAVICLAAMMLSLIWFQSRLGEGRFDREDNSYYEAQLWAAKNTPPGSLFLIDPAKHYGWIAFSHRPSFGNVRDWIVWPTTYSYNPAQFREGLRRLSEFGLDYRDFLDRWPPITGSEALTTAVSERFYAMTEADLDRMARKYGIKYVLYFKGKLKSPPPILNTVFENDDILIVGLDPGPSRKGR